MNRKKNCEKQQEECIKGLRKKLEPFENKIMMKSCKKEALGAGKTHPCDPAPPCDPEKDAEGECPKPALCLERLKNPQNPVHTRCQEGAYLNVASCKHKSPQHPCDEPLACVPGEPKKLPCPSVALCRQRVKNPEPLLVICPNPHDKYSDPLCENAGLWADPPVCEKDEEEIEETIEKKEVPVVIDRKKHAMYSDPLCENVHLFQDPVVCEAEEDDDDVVVEDKRDPCIPVKTEPEPEEVVVAKKYGCPPKSRY